MPNETLKFYLEFYPEYIEDDYPSACISIDDHEKIDRPITLADSIFSFTHTLEFNRPHVLTIKRYGKTNKPQQLTIKKISIDGIDIRNIIWCRSYNRPSYPEPWASQQRASGIVLEETILGETCFGHNGTWTLEFTAPFYKFLYHWMDN